MLVCYQKYFIKQDKNLGEGNKKIGIFFIDIYAVYNKNALAVQQHLRRL